MNKSQNLNIVILHNFDYPEGMATTKRFQLFIDYFLGQGCPVHVVLKSQLAKVEGVEEGYFKGIPFYRYFALKKVKFPYYKDAAQELGIIERFDNLFNTTKRNIVVTGGLTPEFHSLVSKLVSRWEIFFDVVEDYTLLSSVYSGFWKENPYVYLKDKVSLLLYKLAFRKAEEFAIKNATGISVISPYLFNKYKKRSKNLIFIPVTANDNLRVSPFNNKPIRIFFAGSGSLKDGLEILIKAFDAIAEKYPVQLEFSGKIPLEGINRIKKHCLHPGQIKFLGYLTDQKYYESVRNADILLITRTDSDFSHAGFPFKLGEYLATGNPVIATRVAGIDTFLKNEDNAILVEPGKIADLSKALDYLLSNPENAQKIGARGYKVFQENFNASINCSNFFSFIVNTKSFV